MSISTGEMLPGVARAELTSRLGGLPAGHVAIGDDEYLAQRRGVFVTIWHPERGLRGCKGTVSGVRENLVEETRANALSAAFEDWRSPPVEAGELGEIRFEVSVLGELEGVSGEADLDPARYGVVVSAAGDEARRGLLLPGIERIRTVEEQLRIARKKGGIGEDETVELRRFEIEKFVEVG